MAEPDWEYIEEFQTNIYYTSVTISCILMVPTLFVYISMIYHLFINKQKLLFSVKITTFFSIHLSIISSIFWISTFPGCRQHYCGNNHLGNFFLLTTIDFYLSSKISLYIVFVTRLHFSFRDSMYAYSRMTHIVLFGIMFSVITFIIIFNVEVMLAMQDYDFVNSWLPIGCAIAYAVCDVVLSLVTLLLFIRPISKIVVMNLEQNNAHLNIENEHKARKLSVDLKEQIRDDALVHTMTRHMNLAWIAMFSSIICGVIIVCRFATGWYHAETWDKIIPSVIYLDVATMLHMVDNLVSMSCIMLNFKLSGKYYDVLCRKCHNLFMSGSAKVIKNKVTQQLQHIGSTSAGSNDLDKLQEKKELKQHQETSSK